MRMNRQTLPAMLAAAAMLAACATAPEPVVPAPDAAATPSAPPSAPAEAEVIRYTPARLDPADPGLLALAEAVSSAGLVSFAHHGAGRAQDSRLKAALTQALVERHGLGVVILDTPCGSAAILDTYIAGAQTADLAADTVRAAGVEPVLQTDDLAELMTWLRGWNAVFTDMPVRIAGRDCPLAETAEPGRMAIFWGFSFPFADAGEKERALAVRGDLAGAEALWLDQAFSSEAASADVESLWADMRAGRPGDGPSGWQSVDILVRHPGIKPAPGL